MPPSPQRRHRSVGPVLLGVLGGVGVALGAVSLPGQALGVGQPRPIPQLVPQPRDRGTPSQTYGGGTNLIPNPRDRGTPTNTRSGSPTGGVPADAGIGPEEVEPSGPRRRISPALVLPVPTNPDAPSAPEDATPCEALEPPFVNLSADPTVPGGLLLSATDANPVLYAHLPMDRPAIAEWAIFDDTGTLLEVQQLPLPPDAEQVSFTAFTEASGQGLEPQKSYRWSLVLGCDAQDPSLNPGVLGELQRTRRLAPPPRHPQGHPVAPGDRSIDIR